MSGGSRLGLQRQTTNENMRRACHPQWDTPGATCERPKWAPPAAQVPWAAVEAGGRRAAVHPGASEWHGSEETFPTDPKSASLQEEIMVFFEMLIFYMFFDVFKRIRKAGPPQEPELWGLAGKL